MNVFQVGSLPWLVRHKLKLTWRQRGQNRAVIMWLALLGSVFVLGMLALLISILPRLPDAEQLRAGIPQLQAGLTNAGAFSIVLFLFCLALLGVIAGGMQLFSSSTDLELLLASPLRNSVVICSELLELIVDLATIPSVLFTPVVLLLLARGVWEILGGYVAILSFSAITGSLGLSLIYLSIRGLGFRTTRFLVQVFNGSIFFIYLLFSNLIAPALAQANVTVPGRQYLLALATVIPNLLIRTTFLEPLPTLACAGVATLSIMTTTRIISRTIVDTTAPTRDRPKDKTQNDVTQAGKTKPHAFSDNQSWLFMMKEWRLLWRDNTVRASLVLQIFGYGYFLHLFTQGLDGIAASSPVFLSSLTIYASTIQALQLIRRMAIAEEARELLVSCPVPPEAIRMAKLLAAWIPAIALSLPFIGMAIWLDIPWMVTLIITGIATASTCVIGLWSARGVDNADLFKKGKERRQDTILAVLQSIHSMLWVVVGGASSGSGIVSMAIAAVAIGGLIPTIALAYARSYQLRKLSYL